MQSVAEQALMFRPSGSSQPYGSFLGVLGFFGGFIGSLLSEDSMGEKGGIMSGKMWMKKKLGMAMADNPGRKKERN